jgi:hypothetical protein
MNEINLLSSTSDRLNSFNGIRPGDRVTMLVPAGRGRDGQEYAQRSGRVVMVFPTHVVLNLGGRFGTPGVCDEHNYVKHSSSLNNDA